MPKINVKKPAAVVLGAAADAAGKGKTSATVTVKYVAGGNPKFTYSGDGGSSGDLDMAHGTGTITFKLDTGSTAGWQLDSIIFNPSDAFSQTRNGNNIDVTDNNTVTQETEVCYQVKVKKGNSTDTSPDPKITQEPPATPPGP